MNRLNGVLSAGLILALTSIVLTRAFSAYTVAEVLAVLAFVAGALFWWMARNAPEAAALRWPEKLIAAGAVVGLGGLLLKLLFVALGIGVGEHDMESHAAAPNPLLQHIHHLFFNIGFLLYLIATIGMGLRRFTGASR